MKHDKQIVWDRLPGLKLRARWIPDENLGPMIGLREEEDMAPVHQWSRSMNCGKRMAFDIWHFKSEAEITMFLLRWA